MGQSKLCSATTDVKYTRFGSFSIHMVVVYKAYTSIKLLDRGIYVCLAFFVDKVFLSPSASGLAITSSQSFQI